MQGFKKPFWKYVFMRSKSGEERVIIDGINNRNAEIRGHVVPFFKILVLLKEFEKIKIILTNFLENIQEY